MAWVWVAAALAILAAPAGGRVSGDDFAPPEDDAWAEVCDEMPRNTTLDWEPPPLSDTLIEWTPLCTDTGWELLQCSASWCWCVSPNGTPRPNSAESKGLDDDRPDPARCDPDSTTHQAVSSAVVLLLVGCMFLLVLGVSGYCIIRRSHTHAAYMNEILVQADDDTDFEEGNTQDRLDPVPAFRPPPSPPIAKQQQPCMLTEDDANASSSALLLPGRVALSPPPLCGPLNRSNTPLRASGCLVTSSGDHAKMHATAGSGGGGNPLRNSTSTPQRSHNPRPLTSQPPKAASPIRSPKDVERGQPAVLPAAAGDVPASGTTPFPASLSTADDPGGGSGPKPPHSIAPLQPPPALPTRTRAPTTSPSPPAAAGAGAAARVVV